MQPFKIYKRAGRHKCQFYSRYSRSLFVNRPQVSCFADFSVVLQTRTEKPGNDTIIFWDKIHQVKTGKAKLVTILDVPDLATGTLQDFTDECVWLNALVWCREKSTFSMFVIMKYPYFLCMSSLSF